MCIRDRAEVFGVMCLDERKEGIILDFFSSEYGDEETKALTGLLAGYAYALLRIETNTVNKHVIYFII